MGCFYIFYADCLAVRKIITIFATNAISCLQRATAAMRVSTTQAPTQLLVAFASHGLLRLRARPLLPLGQHLHVLLLPLLRSMCPACAPRIKSRFGEMSSKDSESGRRTCARIVSFKNREEGTLCSASGQKRHFFEYSFRIVWRFGDN